jgi:arginase
MNIKEISFLGIGTQQGQGCDGLSVAPQIAFARLPKRWPHFDKFIIQDAAPNLTVHTSRDLPNLSWPIYQNAFQHIQDNLKSNKQQINWGGDHSIAVSTLSAFSSVFQEGCVLWIDAHADLNTPESSLTGNFHGMPLSLLLGIGSHPGECVNSFWSTLRPSQLIYFGLRDLDPYEKYLIKYYGITSFFKDELESHWDDCVRRLLRKIGSKPLHISFDIDAVDPLIAPSTGVPSIGGLNWRQISKLLKQFKFKEQLRSLDIVEINPKIGSAGQVSQCFQIAFRFIEEWSLISESLNSSELSNSFL